MPNVSHYSPAELLSLPLCDLSPELLTLFVGPFYLLISLCLEHHLAITIQSALPFGSSFIYFQWFVLLGGEEKLKKKKSFFATRCPPHEHMCSGMHTSSW